MLLSGLLYILKEEAKIIDLDTSQKPEYLKTALWQWQSGPDPDPWAEEDPTKWNWQDYSDDDCYIIEQAFLLKKGIADLKDYEVDLKKMLQVNKKLRDRVRRVRRQEKSRFMMKLSEPKVVGKDQKTMNQAFGPIEHFLEYIMKRTPKAYELYQRLKTLRIDSQNHMFEDIIQEVIECIERGAEMREKIVKTRSGSQTTNFLAEAKEIGDLIKTNSVTLRCFLKTILKSYTMETFLCYWLNELLRSEDWEEINVITPYLVCLVYTFKSSEFMMKYQEPQGFMANLREFVGNKEPLSLYRGAVLTTEHFKLYDPEKIKYFSWNGVTSTSRDRDIAQKFIELALSKAKHPNEPKVKVLFQIETDSLSSVDRKGMIDISPDSEYPEEKEVILAPGTVFQLLKIRLIEDDSYEVHLKVAKRFGEVKEDVALLGTLQDQAILKDKAIIDGLPSQKSFIVLELLKGNKLIRQLEIRNSGIEEHIMEEIENLRLTTNVKKEDVRLINNTIFLSSLGLLAHYYSDDKLNEIFADNTIQFKDERKLKSKDVELKSLVLGEEALERLYRKSWGDQLKGLSQKIKDASGIKHLDLSIKKPPEGEMLHFLQEIKQFKSLQSLRVKFNENEPISRDVFEIICQIIEGSSTLNRLHLGLALSNEAMYSLEKTLILIASVQNLSLDLKFVSTLSDEELSHLSNSLISLKSLQHLSLNFSGCKEVSNKGLSHLQGALFSLTSLQHLSLNFEGCKMILDEGLDSLKSSLLSLTSLEHLYLDFRGCNSISDEGIKHLSLTSVSNLQHLSLDFGGCKMISDEGIEHLKSSLISLTSLKQLSLKFAWSPNISDEGLKYLKDALNSLTSLQNLSLEFTCSPKITDEGIKHLQNGLISLISLKQLFLKFAWSTNISDKGPKFLKNALNSLTSLQCLSLDFERCTRISDEGLSDLCSALISVTSLQRLTLSLQGCGKVSDRGLNHLKSALLSLTFLHHLTLNFRLSNISDEGLYHLRNNLMTLTCLQYLSLDFGKCNNISDKGLNYLKSGLASFTLLQHLSLNFSGCKEISGKGLNQLLNGLNSFTCLQHLFLDFEKCKPNSNEVRNYLEKSLISLKSLKYLSFYWEEHEDISGERLCLLRQHLQSSLPLQHLSIDVGKCNKISDDGLNHLKDGLMSLTSLQHLNLEFHRNKITDEGLDHLKSVLISLTSLQHLSIDFGKCDNVSNEGLNHLKSALTSLASLQHLSLDFGKCNKISNEGLKHLKDGLISLTSLQHLSLDFSGCREISDEGFNHLKNGLILLRSLQNLSLNFSNCHKISYKGRNFCAELKFIPDLNFRQSYSD